MDKTQPPPVWLEAIARSEQQLAAGQTLDFDAYLRTIEIEDTAVGPAPRAETRRSVVEGR